MANYNQFAPIFLMMPSEEAAEVLLLLSEEEQLELLKACRNVTETALLPVLAETQLASLAPFHVWASKIGDILMALAEVAGEHYVQDILTEWKQGEIMIGEELRDHMLFFEEIQYLSNRSMETVLREEHLSPLLLVESSVAVRGKLLSNVSRRVGKAVWDEFQERQDTASILPEVYHAKGRLCRKVMEMVTSGEITEIEFPLPEVTVKSHEYNLQEVAELVLAMDEDSRVVFLQEYCQPRVLKALFQSPQGTELRAALWPLGTERMRKEWEEAFLELPVNLTMVTVRAVQECRLAMLKAIQSEQK